MAGHFVGGVVLNEAVEGALHVEHHGEEAAFGVESDVGEAGEGDFAGGVVEAVDAEAVGEAFGGVDGEDEDFAAFEGGVEGDDGAGGGLADAAGADADDQALGHGVIVEEIGRGGRLHRSVLRSSWRVDQR